MDRQAEKRWELIQELLKADASGTPRTVSSQRTLFGIKSQVEQTIERIVAEDEAARAQMRADEAAQTAEDEAQLAEARTAQSNDCPERPLPSSIS